MNRREIGFFKHQRAFCTFQKRANAIYTWGIEQPRASPARRRRAASLPATRPFFAMPPDFTQISWNAALEDDTRQLIRLAVREDLERQWDWTTVALIEPETLGTADVVARRDGVVAGMPAARLVLEEIDSRLTWIPRVEDGAKVSAGQTLATIGGPARSLLAAERPLLNMLSRLSGIASLAARYVQAIAGSGARIYDTRKTTPGWRRLEKYAARMGGACNHRTGLFDAVLIKDNHLALVGAGPVSGAAPAGATQSEAAKAGRAMSPAQAVIRAREFLRESAVKNAPGAGKAPVADGSGGDERRGAGQGGAPMIVEVEVDTLDQLRDALAAEPDIVLLDNMSLDELRAAVALRNASGKATELEASGGVTLDTIGQIARTGVERVSVGAITHAAAWLDLGLDWRS